MAAEELQFDADASLRSTSENPLRSRSPLNGFSAEYRGGVSVLSSRNITSLTQSSSNMASANQSSSNMASANQSSSQSASGASGFGLGAGRPITVVSDVLEIDQPQQIPEVDMVSAQIRDRANKRQRETTSGFSFSMDKTPRGVITDTRRKLQLERLKTIHMDKSKDDDISFGYTPHVINFELYPSIWNYLRTRQCMVPADYQVNQYEALLALALIANKVPADLYKTFKTNNLDMIADGYRFVTLNEFSTALDILKQPKTNRLVVPELNMLPDKLVLPAVIVFKMRYIPILPENEVNMLPAWMKQQGYFGTTEGIPQTEKNPSFAAKAVEYFMSCREYQGNELAETGKINIPSDVKQAFEKNITENKVYLETTTVYNASVQVSDIVVRNIVSPEAEPYAPIAGVFGPRNGYNPPIHKLSGSPVATGGFGRIYIHPTHKDVIVKVTKRTKPTIVGTRGGARPKYRPRSSVYMDAIEEVAVMAGLRSKYITDLLVGNVYVDKDDPVKAGVLTLTERAICNLSMFNLMMGTNKNHLPIVELHTLRALEYLHARDMSHRDIKVSNILVYGDPILRNFTFKLTDLGTVIRGQVVSKFRGYMQSMPPETFLLGEYGTKSDMYMWGCMIVQCYVGTHPFDRRTVQKEYEKEIMSETIQTLGMYKTNAITPYLRARTPKVYIKSPTLRILLKYFQDRKFLYLIPTELLTVLLPIFTIYPQNRPNASVLLSNRRYRTVDLYAQKIVKESFTVKMDPWYFGNMGKHKNSEVKLNIISADRYDNSFKNEVIGTKTVYGPEIIIQSGIEYTTPEILYRYLPKKGLSPDPITKMVYLTTMGQNGEFPETNIAYAAPEKQQRVVEEDNSASSALSEDEMIFETPQSAQTNPPERVTPVPVTPRAPDILEYTPTIGDVTDLTVDWKSINLDNITVSDSVPMGIVKNLFKVVSRNAIEHIKIHNRVSTSQGAKSKYLCTLNSLSVPDGLIVDLERAILEQSIKHKDILLCPYQDKCKSYRNSSLTGSVMVIDQAGGAMAQYIKMSPNLTTTHYNKITNNILLLLHEMCNRNIFPTIPLTFDDLWWDSTSGVFMLDLFGYVTRILRKFTSYDNVDINTFLLTDGSRPSVLWFADILCYSVSKTSGDVKAELSAVIKELNPNVHPNSNLLITSMLNISTFNRARNTIQRFPPQNIIAITADLVTDGAHILTGGTNMTYETEGNIFAGVFNDIKNVHQAISICKTELAAVFGSDTTTNITMVSSIGHGRLSDTHTSDYKVNRAIVGSGANNLHYLLADDVMELSCVISPGSVVDISKVKWLIISKIEKKITTNLFRVKKLCLNVTAFVVLVDAESSITTPEQFFTNVVNVVTV